VESLYRRYRNDGSSPAEAFRRSAESVTGSISPIISKHGIDGVYKALSQADLETFATAYNAACPVGSGSTC
jgi:ketol-acid reductoisomerase